MFTVQYNRDNFSLQSKCQRCLLYIIEDWGFLNSGFFRILSFEPTEYAVNHLLPWHVGERGKDANTLMEGG